MLQDVDQENDVFDVCDCGWRDRRLVLPGTMRRFAALFWRLRTDLEGVFTSVGQVLAG